MNYELAKKLEDAGYPLVYNLITITYAHKPPITDCILPTLSELIEACGNDFERLFLVGISEDRKNKNWGAGNKTFFFTGSTPEVAVANFWLELNKTK